MSDPRMELARKRAAIILQVRSGQITATQGAQLLGISRKTYYEWEARGMAGMLSQLEDQPAGRPAKPTDPEKQALEQQVQELEKELALLKQSALLHSLLDQRFHSPTKKKPD